MKASFTADCTELPVMGSPPAAYISDRRREEARTFGQWLLQNLEGLDAIYDPERDPRPTYPSVVKLRAA